MHATNLALRFLLELGGLAALAWASWQLSGGAWRWLAVIAAPLALAVLWGLVVAPNAPNPLAPQVRELVGSALLLGVAAVLALSGRPVPAAAYAALVVVNTVLLAWTADPAVPSAGATR